MPKLHSRVLRVALALIVVGAAGCYTDPKDQLDQAQQMTDLADVINDISVRTSEIQFALDSLRGVVAAQDSTIARLANLAGVSYRSR